MNINEKLYRRKSPEAIALEATTSHYYLFYNKDLAYILEHNTTQSLIDLELERVAHEKAYEEERDRKTKGYVS